MLSLAELCPTLGILKRFTTQAECCRGFLRILSESCGVVLNRLSAADAVSCKLVLHMIRDAKLYYK